MNRDLWILVGDEENLAASEQASEGDLVVRRLAEGIEVGELVEPNTARIEWWGQIEEGLLPATDEIDAAEERRGPLQRIQGSSELRTAIKGVESAHRNRGG